MRSSIWVVAFAVSLVWVSAPAAAATKVFLLGGQSNMAGTGTAAGLPAPYNVPQSDVRFWNYGPESQPDPTNGINMPGVGDGWVDLEGGYGHFITDFGPEVSFGYTLNNMFPGDDIYLVKHGLTSQNLAVYWNPDGTGGVYNRFKARVDGAMANLTAAGLSPTIAGMIWMQGESDAMVPAYAAAYQANLTNFINTVRSDFHTPDMPFVVGRITICEHWGTPSDNLLVRAAQETVPGVVGNASWIDTDDLQLAYAGHYGTQGQVDLGIRFANEFTPAPEPSTLVLAGMGLLILAGYWWWKRLPRSGNRLDRRRLPLRRIFRGFWFVPVPVAKRAYAVRCGRIETRYQSFSPSDIED